ncbi:hypothetical protein [Streptomyces sp. NPDC097619]|uniref:hypothetical protein n=1 Tax=Streptomyces sp. NPDC097619 TaxID=3157228 RepID=UPI003328B46C
MYLVHVELHHPGGGSPPPAAAVAVARVAGVEHASLHPAERPYPVLALYARCRSLADAAGFAARAWQEAADGTGWADWTVVRLRALAFAQVGDVPEGPEGGPG